MSALTIVFVSLIAILHIYIMWFEMFQWESRGPKVFKSIPEDLFEPTKVLAANQGLYNGFLAAGLVWSLFIGDPQWQRNVALCFLLFVLVAGVYGGLTASRRIWFVQVLPSSIAILCLFFS